jgi:hypothetical protein
MKLDVTMHKICCKWLVVLKYVYVSVQGVIFHFVNPVDAVSQVCTSVQAYPILVCYMSPMHSCFEGCTALSFNQSTCSQDA